MDRGFERLKQRKTRIKHSRILSGCVFYPAKGLESGGKRHFGYFDENEGVKIFFDGQKSSQAYKKTVVKINSLIYNSR